MNHDALFKTLLRSHSILQAFFERFLPDAARLIDFTRLDYVDKERVTLEGRKRTGDILVKTRFKGESTFFLIHLEHQAQRSNALAWRLLEYVVLDRRDFRLPVYPVAVLSYADPPIAAPSPLRVDFPNRRVLEFEFDVIDLACLDAHQFVQSGNPAALALAARMKADSVERLRLIRDFYLNLAAASIGVEEQLVVAGFFSAYHPLSAVSRSRMRPRDNKMEVHDDRGF